MPVSVQRLHSLTGHRSSIYALAPSSRPGHFFSAGGDGLVVQWNLNHPEEGVVLAQLNNPVYALYYDERNNLLITGHNFEGIHVLDWQNKRESGSLKFTGAAVFALQYFNNTLYAGTGDGTLTAIELDQLMVRKKVQVTDKSLRCLSINPLTREIAAGYSDWRIRIFDLDTLDLKYELPGHNNSVFTVRYTPSQAYLLSAGRDARIKAWNVQENYAYIGEVAAHLYAINHIEFSPDNKHFVTCSLDKSIKVWELPTLSLLKVIDRARHAGHGTSVNRLLWLKNPNCLISASDDRTLSVWQIEIQE